MPSFQIFSGPEERYVGEVERPKIGDVLKELESKIHQYYFLDVIDKDAIYIKELIWDFKTFEMNERLLYFVTVSNITLSKDVEEFLSKKKSWFEINN